MEVGRRERNTLLIGLADGGGVRLGFFWRFGPSASRRRGPFLLDPGHELPVPTGRQSSASDREIDRPAGSPIVISEDFSRQRVDTLSNHEEPEILALTHVQSLKLSFRHDNLRIRG